MQNGGNITLQLKPNTLINKKLFNVKTSKLKLTLNNFSTFKIKIKLFFRPLFTISLFLCNLIK